MLFLYRTFLKIQLQHFLFACDIWQKRKKVHNCTIILRQKSKPFQLLTEGRHFNDMWKQLRWIMPIFYFSKTVYVSTEKSNSTKRPSTEAHSVMNE